MKPPINWPAIKAWCLANNASVWDILDWRPADGVYRLSNPTTP